MRFELSQELTDQIIFAMENQEIRHLFDSVDCKVVAETDIDPDSSVSDESGDERYLPLPEWVSVDGYMLMESFVSVLRNPLYRESLRHILQSGRGVFRQFKDALKERKDIERLWFRHKQREMKRRVLEWYNDLREIWGLAPLSVDDDAETEDLLLADFTFELIGVRVPVKMVEHSENAVDAASESETCETIVQSSWTKELEVEIREWDGQFWDEITQDKNDSESQILTLIRSRQLPLAGHIEDSVVCIARTPANERAGFIWAVEESGIIGRIVQLGVMLEYRGLGMGTALLHAYQRSAKERGLKRLLFDVPEKAAFFKPSLAREGFVSLSESLEIEIE